MSESTVVDLDGHTLSTTELFSLQSASARISISAEAREGVIAAGQVISNIVNSGEVAYGINTGFGLFSNVVISPDNLEKLQTNLIRSHSAGVGEPLTAQRTRALLALRINVLAKGNSGISIGVLDQMIAAFNANCIPIVPAKGTVGASGDLAPLSHLALGLMGEGPMWDPETGKEGLASEILAKAGLKPIILGPKEGLAMINGTQLIASLGSEAIERASQVAFCADVACALTLEVLCGTVRAYHPLIHKMRPHHGQQLVASRIRAMLQPDEPSELFNSHQYVGKVQDAYSLRCAPQVHGVACDTINFCRGILDTELNSATDNPMVFTQQQVDEGEPMGFVYRGPTSQADETTKDQTDAASKPEDASDISDLEAAKAEVAMLRGQLKKAGGFSTSSSTNWAFNKKPSACKYTEAKGGGMVISGGNFHGEYPAKALDFLAIGVHELAAISERRIERMCNPSLSGLPAFLVKDGGFNSGFMIAHCTAAAMVSENKVLCHPSSVDSISTSAAKEDHVSMGGFAARKAVEVVGNVERVIAIELLAACQALDLHRPLRSTRALEAVHALVREKVAPWDEDRHMSPDIEHVVDLVRSGAIMRAVAPFLPEGIHLSTW